MKLRIHNNQMEEVEGLHNEYPYAYHHVDLQKTAVPWHWHEALEINLVTSGKVKVYTTNQSQVFQAGEGIFTNSNILVSMENMQDCILDSHLFHPVFLSGHFKSVFETKYLNPVTQNRNLDIICLRDTDPVQKQILRKLQIFQTQLLHVRIFLKIIHHTHHYATASGTRTPMRMPSIAPQKTCSGVCPSSSFNSFILLSASAS